MLTDSGKPDVNISFDFIKSKYNTQTGSDAMAKRNDAVIDSMVTNRFVCRQDYPAQTEYELVQWYMNAISLAQIMLKKIEVAMNGHMYICAKHARRLFKVKEKMNSINDTSNPCDMHGNKDVIEAGILAEKYASYLSLLKRNIRKCSSCLRDRPMDAVSMDMNYTTWNGFVRGVTPHATCKQRPQTVPVHDTQILGKMDSVWRVSGSHNSGRSEAMMDKLKSLLCRQSGSYTSTASSSGKESDEQTESTVVDSEASSLEVLKMKQSRLSGGNLSQLLDPKYGTREAPTNSTPRPRISSNDAGTGTSTHLSIHQFRLPQHVNRPANYLKGSTHADRQDRSVSSYTHLQTVNRRTKDFLSKTVFPDNQISTSRDTGALHDSEKKWHNLQTIDFLTALAPNVYLIPPPSRNPFSMN